MLPDDPISVTEFVELLNQTFEFAYPIISIVGELANFRISKNKWVYFDLKDETSSLKFFGSVYQLKQALEDGMLIKVSCTPRMHNNYGFSMHIQSIEPVGEGSLKRASELMQLKLSKEGLFDESRKRLIPHPPKRVGLITSSQSAAYTDFTKIINHRWRGIEIDLVDVQVQGFAAIEQIIDAINYFNEDNSTEVIVLIRGGGSPEDLAAFSSEEVTRAVAASDIPTLVAVGHEIDVSLAELAADKRASTPSNAAELLVPDRLVMIRQLKENQKYLASARQQAFKYSREKLKQASQNLQELAFSILRDRKKELDTSKALIEAYNPLSVLERGYSIVRIDGKAVKSTTGLKLNDILDVRLANGELVAAVTSISPKRNGK
jgi:exodeoxyribonuclease VII large subunit